MQYIHKVKRGESLREICVKYSVFGEDLLATNNLGEEDLREGVLLVVDIPEGERYVVKPFDNLDKIANKFGTDKEAIMQFNNIKEVFLGQIIFIPNKC